MKNRRKSENVQQFCSSYEPKTNSNYPYPDCLLCKYFKHGIVSDRCTKHGKIIM